MHGERPGTLARSIREPTPKLRTSPQNKPVTKRRAPPTLATTILGHRAVNPKRRVRRTVALTSATWTLPITHSTLMAKPQIPRPRMMPGGSPPLAKRTKRRKVPPRRRRKNSLHPPRPSQKKKSHGAAGALQRRRRIRKRKASWMRTLLNRCHQSPRLNQSQ